MEEQEPESCVAGLEECSHWIRNGDFISFADYRFVLCARLNLLPTKTAVRRAGRPDVDTICPKCHRAPETLGHVLNACTPNAGLMRARHNTVLHRLIKAIPNTVGPILVQQKLPESPGDLRPDLVVYDHERKRISIVDVTIPFEGEESSFAKAREEKIRTYTPLKEWLTERDGSYSIK